MKIALVRQRFLEHGGAERYMNAVASALAERGHQVHIFAHRWDEAANINGVDVHRVPMTTLFSFTRASSFAKNCREMLAREKFDVVFSFERTLKQDVYRAGDGCHREYLNQRLRYSSAWKRATLWLNPLHATMLRLERRVFSPENTRVVIANSHQRKEEIVRHYGFPAERIVVIHNGVDLERFQPRTAARTGNDFVLLFVGSGFRGKGLAYCVKALARLPQNVRLKVVGKGNPDHYIYMARRMGVAERLEFAGTVSDMPAMYATGDLLVLPAVYESFANVCLEAMASGLPVVTSRINGASEIIEQGVNGAVIEEPSDDVALAEAIRPFLEKAKWWTASAEARKTAESLPFAENVEKTLKIIGGLIGGQ